MGAASFNLWASSIVAVFLLFNPVDASSSSRKLLTGDKHSHDYVGRLLAILQPKRALLCFAVAAPEVPVVDSTCALSTVEGDTVTFSNPE